MKKKLTVLLLIIFTISCYGCGMVVSEEQYRVLQRDFETQISLNQAMKEEMRTLREELIVTRRELETAKSELKAFRGIASLLPPTDGGTGNPSLQAGDGSDMPPLLPPDESLTASSTSSASSAVSSSAEATSSAVGAAPGEPASASSVSSAVDGASSASSVLPPIDEKAQLKFKDIADALS